MSLFSYSFQPTGFFPLLLLWGCWVCFWVAAILLYFLLKFPSWMPRRLATQRNVAGWMLQYFTGLANRLMAEYGFFFSLGDLGQKSLYPTLLILLPWRKITCADGETLCLIWFGDILETKPWVFVWCCGEILAFVGFVGFCFGIFEFHQICCCQMFAGCFGLI